MQQVDIGGYRLAVQTAGTGAPTVVLEAGGGLDSTTWDAVWEPLTTVIRAVRYDRAGLGRSEAPPVPQTYQDIVETLHTVLDRAQIPGPYVMVGHSLGGLLVRLYAQRYPSEVVGMVLVDAVHPEQNQRALDLFPPHRVEESAQLSTLRRNLQLIRTVASGVPALVPDDPEQIDRAITEAQVRSLGPLGDLPLIVLTQGRSEFPPEWSEDFARYVRERYLPMALELQAQLASLSTRGRQIMALQSGHMIHQDEPELVLDAIREVVVVARGNAGRTAAN